MTLTLEPFQFSHGGQKLRQLGDNTVIAFAGYPMLMDCLLESAFERLSSEESSVEKQLQKPKKIVEATKKAFNDERMKRIEENILRKHAFDLEQYQEFYKEHKIWEPQLAKITEEIEKFELHLELLMGINTESEIEIHYVGSPGASENLSAIGYHTIGSGAPYAMQTFMSYDYQRDFPFPKSLFIAFEAKKNGEKGLGVGERTDIWVLKKDKIVRLKEDQIVEIGRLLEKRDEEVEQLNEEIFDKVSEMRIP